MEIWTAWGKCPHLHLALGNFDGLHLGHQFLIRQMVEKAHSRKAKAAVFTFYPHPLQVLAHAKAPALILSQQDKQQKLAEMGVDLLFEIPFTLELAACSPEEFERRILVEGMGVEAVFVGYNYSYGHKGQGNPQTLRQAAQKYNFDLEIIPPVKINGQPVSSTLIRQLVQEGQVAKARELLGFAPFLTGEVVQGERRGGEVMGIPTANLELDRELLVPRRGVYAVRVQHKGNFYRAVANLGKKPTFHGDEQTANLEVHLLDFAGDLYGQKIKVEFWEYLRDEKRFNSMEELVAQIKKDVDRTWKIIF